MRHPKLKEKCVKVNLFPCDFRDASGKIVPYGLQEYVGMLLGPKPDFFKVASILNERLFHGKVRGFTYRRSSYKKERLGYLDVRTKTIYLQECLFAKGVNRTVLVKILISEMIRAYLDCLGLERNESVLHGSIFMKEVKRINKLLKVDIQDIADKTLDTVAPRQFIFRCMSCDKEVKRWTRRSPNGLPNYKKHRVECGGNFEIQEFKPLVSGILEKKI